MAINTLITIREAINEFVEGHGQLKRIIWEANDQRANYITEGDEFPILFANPVDVVTARSINIHTIRIYVYSRLNDDRSDIIENANDTSLILRDIRVWWNDYGVDDIEIKDDPIGIFEADKELDKLVGYYADIRFEIPSHGRCQVPVDVVPTPPLCADGFAVNSNSTYSLTVPSGTTQPIPDTFYEIEVDGVLEDSFQLPTLEDSIITIELT